MTHQPIVCAMICQRNAAAWTSDHLSAMFTGNKGVIPSAIEQQNRLFFSFQVFFKRLYQLIAERCCIAGGQLLVHIRNNDFRQLCISIAMRQGLQRISAVFSHKVTL